MKREHFLIMVALFFCHYGFGQDQTNFTQFYLNPYLINPSYAGIDGRTSIALTYRKQWATIKGGPVISNLSFHSPLSKRTSLGLSITSDERGLLSNTGAMLTFGYNIPLSPTSFFRFGISGGASSNTVDLEPLMALNDPALANILDNNMSLQGNAGLSFHLNTFHMGVSFPVIFQPSYIAVDDFNITEVKPFESIIFHFSNRFYFNNDRYIFEPYAVYRMTKELPHQYEVAGILHLNHVLWVGSSYKDDYGISALGGVKIKNSLAIGAAYGLATSGENELNSPTYEITLGMLLGKKKKEIPMYSFVDTEKAKVKKGTGKSASEQLAAKKRQEELIAKKKQVDAENKKKEEAAAVAAAKATAQHQAEEAAKQQEARNTEIIAAQQIASNQTAVKPKETTSPPPVTTQPDVVKQQEVAKQQEAAKQQELARQEEVRKQQVAQEQERKRQAEVLLIAQQDAARKQKEEQARQQQQQQKQPDPVVVVPPQQDPIYTSTIKQDSVVVTHKPRFGQIDESMEVLRIDVTEHNEEDELERLSRIKLHQQDPDESHDGTVVHPNSERHEYVKKGTHKQELQDSNYLVSGVFKGEKQAKEFTQGLEKMGFSANYGHSTEKKVWYVYLVKTNNINVIRQQRDKFRQMKIFRDAWIITVTP
jgi:type IX secretion system PorP/SprF family membrane protein